MKKTLEIPENIADRIHYYGVIETPSDLIGFYCGSYEIKENTITAIDLLLDTSVTRKSYITRVGRIFFEKVEFINYMAMFFPYVPYKNRGKQSPDIREDDIVPILGAQKEKQVHLVADVFSDSLTLSDAQRKFLKKYIETQLTLHKYNIKETAKALGIELTSLYRKMRGLGIHAVGTSASGGN